MSEALATMPEQDKRDDVSVKMDREVVQLAKAAAALDNMSLAEWLSETIRPLAVRRISKGSVKKTAKEADD